MARKERDPSNMNLTPAQRQAIIDRDGHQCQSQLHSRIVEGKGKVVGADKLEVDHLFPKRGARTLFDFPPNFINTPEALLTKCVPCHRDHPESHHPDAHKAEWEYRNGDHQAFQKMVRNREALLAEGSDYSNEQNQMQDLITAEENTQAMDKKKPGWWPWPRRNKP